MSQVSPNTPVAPVRPEGMRVSDGGLFGLAYCNPLQLVEMFFHQHCELIVLSTGAIVFQKIGVE